MNKKDFWTRPVKNNWINCKNCGKKCNVYMFHNCPKCGVTLNTLGGHEQ